MKRLTACCAVLVVSGALAAAADTDLRLIDAARRGDVAAVRELIRQKVPLTAADADGSTALHEAVRFDRTEIVDLLIAAGADVKAATRYGVTPLALACSNGHPRILERLLNAGADPNSTSEGGQTALMTAALTGNPESVQLLLTRGARVNDAEPIRGQTALMWAASEGNTEAARLLIAAGASLQTKSSAGFTPLLFAVRGGHLETVEALLSRGADVNDVAADGTSALNMAVVNAYFGLAAVLLDRGANPNAPDARGSALHTLAWLREPGSDGGNGLGRRSYGPPVPAGATTSLELAAKLLDRGADPNARVTIQEGRVGREGNMRNPPLITLGRHIITYSGATPFYLAARNGDAPYMRLLAERGADPTIPNAAGVTPLMVAAGLDTWEGETPGPFTGVPEADRLEAVKLALELGADIDAATDFGDYTLEGDPEYTLLYPPHNFDDLAAKVLGGDARWGGSTALHGAVISNQPSLVQFLVDNGARVDAKNKAGWTPLMMAGGVFLANAKREYPEAAAILMKAMADRGLQPGAGPEPDTSVPRAAGDAPAVAGQPMPALVTGAPAAQTVSGENGRAAGPGPRNLKVLPKTWTNQQVRALMQTFSESLGVQCSYCHAADPDAPPPPEGRAPTLNYALDLKDEKENARRMIRMVMALNGETLKGLGDQFVAEKVTCYTCHAGSEVPQRAPEAGWARGGFSLLPGGPPVPARGAAPPAPARPSGN